MFPLSLVCKMLRTTRLLSLLLLLVLAVRSASAQQDYVGRYDIYSGFTTLSSPALNQQNRGYHFQAGYNWKPWLVYGFDYSITNGHNTLTPKLLPTALQQQLGAQILQLIEAGIIPPSFQVAVPTESTVQTFAAGPQFNYRRFQRVTLFARPSLGAVHETATPHPRDPVNAAIAMELAPAGHKSDWTGFYGFGGGYDLNVTRHIGLRMQADLTYYHLFNDILRDGTWNVRWAVGPSFHFGRNIRPAKNVSPMPAPSGPAASGPSASNP